MKYISYLKRKKGVSLVEFSISFPLFIFVILTCLNFSIIQRDRSAIDSAILFAARAGNSDSINYIEITDIEGKYPEFCDEDMGTSLLNICNQMVDQFKLYGLKLDDYKDLSDRRLISDKNIPSDGSSGIQLLIVSDSVQNSCKSILVKLQWQINTGYPNTIATLSEKFEYLRKSYCFPLEESLMQEGCSPIAMQKNCLANNKF